MGVENKNGIMEDIQAQRLCSKISKELEAKLNEYIEANVPDGYEVDKESSLNNIVIRKKERWSDNKDNSFLGFYVDYKHCESIEESIKSDTFNNPNCHFTFANKELACSAVAMAQISQIIANDKRFGGFVTDVEWADSDMPKYVIKRTSCQFILETEYSEYYFLAFHTKEQRSLFFNEYYSLVNKFLMI